MQYERSDEPDTVILDGMELDAAEECNRLAEELADAELEIEDLEDTNHDLTERLTAYELGEDYTDEYREVERLIDRIRYATNERTERQALDELIRLFYPDDAHQRKLYGQCLVRIKED